ncbi:MAG: OsmC family protein [Rhodospirillaceae bacterium]
MVTRSSEAEWRGNLRDGEGRMKLGSGAFEGSYSYPSRFESGQGTNPEELIGAAHAGCFSMALAAGLTQAGYAPTRVHTAARVHLDKVSQGFAITAIDLDTQAEVPGIDDAAFQREAQNAKQNCPVSKALQAVTINLTARLVGH